jgi:hypothetical protein
MRGRASGAAFVASALAALVIAGCGGNSTPVAADGAARLVPDNALLYVDAALNGSSNGLPEAGKIVSEAETRLAAITGGSFAADVKPWLGSEAAVALVPYGESAVTLILLAVRDKAAAARFVAATHTAAAQVIDGYVVIGDAVAVRAAAKVAAGRRKSLATDRGFDQRSGRILYGYVDPAGVAGVLGGHTGVLGMLASVIGGDGAGATLTRTWDGARLALTLTRPPNLKSAAEPQSFKPTLAGVLPASTTLLIDTPSLLSSGPGLLRVLAASGADSALTALIPRLGTALKAQGVALAPLEALFGSETGIFQLDGATGLITRFADQRAARIELASVQPALAGLFSAGVGSEPLVGTQMVHGVAITQWQLGQSGQLDFAVFDGLVVIATSEAVITSIVERDSTLSGSSLYRSVLGSPGTSVGPVVYGALSRLVRLGGLDGVLGSVGLAESGPALARISAVGLQSTGGPTQTNAELYFTIS